MIDASEGEDHMTSGNSRKEAGEEIRQPDTIKKPDRGRKLTDEEIVAHAVVFILAGYETTANTLAYTSCLESWHSILTSRRNCSLRLTATLRRNQ